jgi:hypothetical protein
VQWAVRVPRSRLAISIFSAVAILQGSQVLAKTYQLRHVSPEIRAAMDYLKSNPPSPNRVFMYPEGHYRIFPCDHNWYLGYRLRELWRGDNDQRIALFSRYKVGAIVVKKKLVRDVSPDTHDLGVYPAAFVRDIERDPRFQKRFENSAVVIYSICSQ